MNISLLDKIEKKIENLISEYKILKDKYKGELKEKDELNNKYKDLFLKRDKSESHIGELEQELQYYKEQASELNAKLAQKEEKLKSYIEQAEAVDNKVDSLLTAIDNVLEEKVQGNINQ